MKTRTWLFTAIMAMSVTSVSAEVELLFHMLNGEHHSYTAIERSKKLFILDDDDNTQFEIKNYKKSGNIETFTIENDGMSLGKKQSAQITLTLDDKGRTCKIEYKNATYFEGGTYDVKTTDEDPREYNRMMRYFNQLTGNPVEQGCVPERGFAAPGVPESGVAVPGVGGASDAPANPVDKVKGRAKDAANKVKGLFKKK